MECRRRGELAVAHRARSLGVDMLAGDREVDHDGHSQSGAILVDDFRRHGVSGITRLLAGPPPFDVAVEGARHGGELTLHHGDRGQGGDHLTEALTQVMGGDAIGRQL